MDSLYYLLEKEKIEILLSALENIKAGTKSKNIEISRRIIIDRLQIAIENEEVNELVINEYFIKLYLHFFFRHHEIVQQQINDFYSREKSKVAVRRFENIGSVCFGFPIVTKDAIYDIFKGEPTLITLQINGCFNYRNTEIGWLNKQEIKFLSALTFSLPAPHGPINSMIPSRDVNCYYVPYEFIFGTYPIDSPLALKRSRSAIMLLDHLNFSRDCDCQHNNFQKHYIFNVENQDSSRVNKILDNFNIEDDLLLRTSYLLLKSVFLLRSNSIFIEDAAANLYYAIEGCLRLIHRKNFTGEFKINEVADYLKNNFIEDYAIKELLDESYMKRLQIVHPENISKINWIPEILIDEFFEQLGFGYCLLYYAITGDFLPPHYTYH